MSVIALKVDRSIAKSSARGEAHSAQQAQMVFLKAAHGIADRADQARVDVGAAANVVEDLVGLRIEQQRVDGEVAAQHVLTRIGFEVNTCRMAAVQIVEIAAKGGDLHLIVIQTDEHDTEMRADLIGVRKNSQQFFGQRRGGNVVVFGSPAEQKIANTAAGEERGMPCRAQLVDYFVGGGVFHAFMLICLPRGQLTA